MQDWGRGPSNDDLEKKVIEIRDYIKNKFNPQKGLLPILVIVVLIVIGAYTSMYEVDTEETGVVLRFGKFSSFADPGLHFKLPLGIDRVYLVPTGRVLKEEFGFRTIKPDVRSTFTKRGLEEESLTLTGDLNVSDVEWIVQFQGSIEAAVSDGELPLRVRIGVHAGETIADMGDVFGTAVNLAARVVDRAAAGEVLVTDTVRQIAVGGTRSFSALGEVELKGIPEPIGLHRFEWR